MKEFLGGMMGMNKAISVEEIRNEIMVGCNGVVAETQKGNNYVIATIGNKLTNMPVEIVESVGHVIDERIDNKMNEFARLFETRMLEIVSGLNQKTNSQQSEVNKLYSYNGIIELVGKKSISVTLLKYHFVNKGWMDKNDISQGKFRLKFEDINDYDDVIKDCCEIKNKELYFKEDFSKYILDNYGEIKNAKRIYESNKLSKVKNKFISEFETRLLDAINSKNNSEKMLENDMNYIIKEILEDNSKAWMSCYIALGKSKKFHFMNEYNAYNRLCKKQKHYIHDVSKLHFVLFEKRMLKEFFDIVFEKYPEKALEVITRYQENKELDDLFEV